MSASLSGNSNIDARQFRGALGSYASGITVIGSMLDDRLVGFTCQSFYSVSMEPPLISFSVMVTSSSWPLIRQSGKFSVNVLSREQELISTNFGRSNIDRWSGVDWVSTSRGNPVIKGALTWLDCEIYDVHRAGDHDIVVGLVNEIAPQEIDPIQAPLLYYRGSYMTVAQL